MAELKLGVITMSDRASAGEYEDESGPLAEQLFNDFLQSKGVQVETQTAILPDDEGELRKTLLQYLKEVNIICITGGTGLGPKDISPDVVKPLLTKEIPGVMEYIRVKYGAKFPNALLSRALAGVIGDVLIYVIPGSPKAVKEYLDEILPTILHSIKMIQGGGH